MLVLEAQKRHVLWCEDELLLEYEHYVEQWCAYVNVKCVVEVARPAMSYLGCNEHHHRWIQFH